MANVLGVPPIHTDISQDDKKVTPPWQQWFSLLSKTVHQTGWYTVSLDPSSVAANTVARQTFTVTGLLTTDIVVVNPPALDAGLEILNCRVTATDTLQITFWNSTGSPIDAAEQDYLILAIRQ